MSDPLQKQQPPQSQLDNEMKQNEQEQNAMWDSVALAALTEDDNNDDIRAGEEHNKNDQGDNGTVLAASSDVASVQSNSNGIQDINNSANAFGESPFDRINSKNMRHCLRYFLARINILERRVVCYVLSIYLL